MIHPNVRPEDVLAIAGKIDSQIVDQIVGTGATIDEIAMAVAEIEEERSFDSHRSVSASPRVAMVRVLLEPVLANPEGNVSRGRD